MSKKLKIIFLILVIALIGVAVASYVGYSNYASNTENELDGITELKPIIYIYPTETTEVTVKVSNPEKFIVSYPEYEGAWKVIANPNGDLTYEDKKLYSLYYEASDYDITIADDGFVLSREEVVDFLDEKLSVLGLNYKEREEMIIYWLPKLVEKNYVYIRFETTQKINENMSLNITPQPDTLIRVWMIVKPLDKPVTIKEQPLIKVERQGFTVVEWGGSIYEEN